MAPTVTWAVFSQMIKYSILLQDLGLSLWSFVIENPLVKALVCKFDNIATVSSITGPAMETYMETAQVIAEKYEMKWQLRSTKWRIWDILRQI